MRGSSSSLTTGSPPRLKTSGSIQSLACLCLARMVRMRCSRCVSCSAWSCSVRR
nr:MAG TPA: hypothetical protein [Caudoviricetes sp.]